MAEKTFKLEIVTPRKVVFSGEVTSFSAPGVAGNFQVLVNHAPLLSAIGVGKVKVLGAAGAETQYATSGGFVEVLKNEVVLLAETVERAEEIDVSRAESGKERAQRRLADRMAGIDVERARFALARALNRLKIARKE